MQKKHRPFCLLKTCYTITPNHFMEHKETTEAESVLAWHFLPEMGKTAYDSKTVVVGETMTHTGKVCICERGLHASEDLLDALSYRRGPVLCRVEVSGEIQRASDKLCGRNRKCLTMVDITPQLREFALLCAEKVLPIYEKRYLGDSRVRDCIAVTRKYLKGDATKEELIAARKAAYAAYAYAYAAYAAADAAYASYAAAADAYAAYAYAYAAYAAYAAAADAAYAANAYAAAADADAAYAANAYADAAYAYADTAAADADAAYARKEMRDWQRETLLSLLK